MIDRIFNIKNIRTNMMGKRVVAHLIVIVFGVCFSSTLGFSTVVPLVREIVVKAKFPVQNVNVLGKDTRTGIPFKYRSLRGGMGLLHKPNSKFSCSAFCVAPDVIATAAHCVLSGKKGKKRPEVSKIYFYPYKPRRGRFGRRSIAIGQNDLVPRNMFSDAPFYRKFRTSIKNFKYDWALLKLRSRTCDGHSLVVKSAYRSTLHKASKTGRIFQIAFHGDKGKMRLLYYSGVCRLRIRSGYSRAPKVLKHDCDTANGSSGSPIFMQTSAGPVVIGINTGSITTRKVLRRNGRIVKRFKKKSVINTAVNARVFKDKIDKLAEVTIYFGTVKLVQLQKLLKKKKFYNSKVDGIYGPGTRAAIMAYQRLSGMPVSGFPSVRLLSALSKGKNTKSLLKEAHKRKVQQGRKLIEENRKWAEKNRKSHNARQLEINRERALRGKPLEEIEKWVKKYRKAQDVRRLEISKARARRRKLIEENRKWAERNRKSHYARQLEISRERARKKKLVPQ